MRYWEGIPSNPHVIVISTTQAGFGPDRSFMITKQGLSAELLAAMRIQASLFLLHAQQLTSYPNHLHAIISLILHD